MNVLTLDIEIAPTLATTWGLWNVNLGTHMIVGNSYVLSVAAKWYGDEDVMFFSLHDMSQRKMLQQVYKLLEEADVVVGYNLDKFDLKILNKEFVEMGWAPPAPYKTIDLLKVMKNRFRFTSNKLDYIAKQFKLGAKTKHPGHDLWLSCMNKKASDYHEAWAIMEEYNIQDVLLTEKLYDRVKGWIPNAPSHSAFTNSHVCPTCGGTHLQKRGFAITSALKYQRFQCRSVQPDGSVCGAWSRDNKAVEPRGDRLITIR